VATRALIRGRSLSRAPYAAGLLVALLGALLGAWFVSGWHDVRMRQHEIRDAPRQLAERRAEELARELHDELEDLIAREVRRPYFHYQNLMHDPRASPGRSVSPSPLAQRPEDRLVLGYFQIDGSGKASTPTINDDVPELSEPQHVADNLNFRDRVMRDLARELTPPGATAPVVVASAEGPPPEAPSPGSMSRSQPRTQGARGQGQVAQAQPPTAQAQDTPQAPQVIELDPSVYAQNVYSNAVYWEQAAQVAQQQAPPAPPPEVQPRVQPQPAPAPRPPATRGVEPPAAPTPVLITISPLEWRTVRFADAPALVAVRTVSTPDGNLAQGFVVDRATLASRLGAKTGDLIAELHVGGVAELAAEASRPAAFAPGWQLTVEPSPTMLARASADAREVARAFVIRFVTVGAIAALAAACVLLLVLRAEKLARERSQFAAAAAHELRTPLAGLQLYGDMLADGLGDPAKVRDYGRRMSEEASRLGRVVSNVLGFSQLERGNLSVDAQPGELGAALCELAERAQPALDRTGAVLELDVSPDLRARFDRDALARIVGNLLDNAEKYARGADDRTIRLAARVRGDVVEVVVQDHGPGIADHAKLFRAFSRGVSIDGPAGLGLGLALSRSLAQAMGGTLVHRASETGATFVLELPRA
jgi:signal transduction histidine kinase